MSTFNVVPASLYLAGAIVNIEASVPIIPVFSSGLNLSLGQVPQVLDDTALYRELLDIHDAIEQLSLAIEKLQD